MSTIKEILERVDRNKPNAFSDEKKLRWIAELDGKISLQVFLTSYVEASQLQYKYPEDLGREPLIAFPHEDIYDAWLECKIDLQNGETDKYQNGKVVFDALYEDYLNWFCNTYEPAHGNRENVIGDQSATPVYYITAYGLAVKQGYDGTLDEWLASLRGPQGPKGDPGAKISIGTVTTLPAGSKAVASISGTDDNPKLNLSIPEGTDDALRRAGGTMTGDINMDGNRINGLTEPLNDDEPVIFKTLKETGVLFRGRDYDVVDIDKPFDIDDGYYAINSAINGVGPGVLWNKKIENIQMAIQVIVHYDASLIWMRTYYQGTLYGWRQIGFGFGEELPDSAQNGQLFFVKQ